MMMDWAVGADEAIAPHVVALPVPVDVYYDEGDVDDDVRRRSFTTAWHDVDRVGHETDFLPVKRLRSHQLPPLQSTFHHKSESAAKSVALRAALQLPGDFSTPVSRRAVTVGEIADRRLALYRTLLRPHLRFDVAMELADRARSEGAVPSLACYNRLLHIAAASPEVDAMSASHILSQMAADGIAPSANTVDAAVSCLVRSSDALSEAVHLCLSHREPGIVCERSWGVVLNAVDSYIADAATNTSSPDRITSLLPPHITLSIYRDAEAAAKAAAPTLHRSSPVAPIAVRLWHLDDLAVLQEAIQSINSLDERTAGEVRPYLVAAALRRLHAESGERLRGPTLVPEERSKLRFALAAACAAKKIELDGDAFEVVLRGCKDDVDVRGVAFFLQMKARSLFHARAVCAAAQYMSLTAFDDKLVALLKSSKAEALWAHVAASHVPEAAAAVGGRAGPALEAVAQLAHKEGNLELCVRVFAAGARDPRLALDPAELRRLLRICASTVTASKSVPSQEALSLLESLRIDVVGSLVQGLRGASDCVQKFSAWYDASVQAPKPAKFTAAQWFGARAQSSYIIVLDSSAWAEIAVDSAAAAVIAKQMSAYDRAATGGILVVGLESVLAALDDPRFDNPASAAQRAQVAVLFCEWGKTYSQWFKPMPLDLALAAGGVEQAGAVVAELRSAAMWARDCKEAGCGKVMTVVSSPAAKDALLSTCPALKPVATVQELVSKLSITTPAR